MKSDSAHSGVPQDRVAPSLLQFFASSSRADVPTPPAAWKLKHPAAVSPAPESLKRDPRRT